MRRRLVHTLSPCACMPIRNKDFVSTPLQGFEAGAQGESTSLTLHVTLTKSVSKATRQTVHSRTLDGYVHSELAPCTSFSAEED